MLQTTTNKPRLFTVNAKGEYVPIPSELFYLDESTGRYLPTSPFTRGPLDTNPILKTDSYKFSQWAQYHPELENIFEYLESRGGKFKKTLFYGLQKELLELTAPVTQQHIEEADKFITAHIGPGVFNRKGWQYIVDKHKGYLPVKIDAVPEGTVVPVKNMLFSIEATDKECAWVVGPLETRLVRAAWYGTTVATVSYNVKQTISKYLEMTGDPSLLPFKFHDFGARGVSSAESAGIGGSAHLISFRGTDTVEGILHAQKYYFTDAMVGLSIAASEHSTMTSWGGPKGEKKAMKNMIDTFLAKDRIVACVSDSYNIYNAIIQYWGTEMRDQIIKSGGTLVVRPDSGDPVSVTLKCVELLADKFGASVNVKGYKVLNPCIRLIQGDGIEPVDEDTVELILANFAKHGWSADNIAFGCGGGLLQKVNRDTCKFAMKASAVDIGGQWIDVYKDPVTDPGKTSKRGRLVLVKDPVAGFKTVRLEEAEGRESQMFTVYENGEMKRVYTFEEVQANSERDDSDDTIKKAA